MKKKKGLIITIVIISILLILGIIGVLLYLTTDLFKTNSELFFEYAAKNAEISEMLNTTKNNPQNDSKYTTKAKVGFELTSSDAEIANEALPARNFVIEYTGKTDKENQLASGEAVLKYLSTELFAVKYRQTGDTYAIKSDEVINKYLAIENNNLKELAAKYQIEGNFPDKILNRFNEITQNDIENIKNTYLPIIQNNIPAEAFSRKKGEQITVYGKNLLTNRYTLSLTKTQAKNILTQVLEALKQDTTTLNIISKIANMTMEELQEGIQTTLDELKASADGETEVIVIHLYENEKELCRTELIINGIKMSIDFDRSQSSKRVLIDMTEIFKEEEYKFENVEFVQSNKDGEEQVIAIVRIKDLEEQTITLSIQNKESTTNVTKKDTIINLNINDQTYFTMTVNKEIEFVENIEIEKLDNTNSVKFNDFAPEYGIQTLQAIGTRLTQVFTEKLTMLMINEAIQQVQNDNLLQPTNPIEPTNIIEPITTSNI